MKKIALTMMLVLLTANLAVAGQSQDPGGAPGGVPDPNAPIRPEKAKAIHRLLDLMGSAKLGQQVMGQMLPLARSSFKQVPEGVWDEIEKEFNSEISFGKLQEMTIPIYNRHFSDEEINEMIKFYESPIGKKLSSVMPQIAAESMQVGMEWADQILKRIRQRLKEKGYSGTAD